MRAPPETREGKAVISPLTPIISLHRPWADWVALGWKKIETRTHSRFKKLAGGVIAIHASKTWDLNWERAANNYLTPNQREFTKEVLPKWDWSGKIICYVFVERFGRCLPSDSRDAMIECFPTIREGLWLSGVTQLSEPIEIRGMQGIFYRRERRR